MFRIGHGYDAHRLKAGRRLILGGVDIPHSAGLDGHSDADVAVHALMDALLGALALGDIGMWFPPSDKKYKNADSIKLLSRIWNDEKFAAYKIGNCDITIIAERPKLSPFIRQMRENISKTLACEIEQVSIKATTTESLGFSGREEGIAAHSVVILKKK